LEYHHFVSRLCFEPPAFHVRLLIFDFDYIFSIRFGMIVGEAGILMALLLVFLCSLCTSLTMTSIAAIATNDVPRYGGVLYVLSTSLGTGLGGAIS
jgi:amino acid transporter